MKIKTGQEQVFVDWKQKNSEDEYGKCCFDFAEQWADEMEKAIAGGATVGDCMDATMREVDNRPGMGITGFMYGCAVSVLSHCWEHGEALRRAHNKATQIRDEGDRANEREGVVLNPAILSVSVPDDSH